MARVVLSHRNEGLFVTEPTLTDLIAALPARIRVHELAKRAGRSSKEVLAALAELGTPASSASSTVTAEVATQLLTQWLGDAGETATESAPMRPEPQPVAPDFGRPAFVAPEPAASQRAPEETLAEEATPDETAAESRPRRSRGRRRRTGDRVPVDAPDTEETGHAPEAVESAAPDVAVDAPIEDQHELEAGAGEGDAETESESESAGRRRRRRGRRRGRSGAEADESGDEVVTDAEESPVTDPATETGESEDETEDGDESGEEGSAAASRRRRRRRRRTGGGGSDEPVQEDDPDNTVVHVRESRSASTEVQGVRGSTRLEAKRQRRRDTRDSRRRPQILTEAEFLARRESVDRVMAVRERGELAQVALLEDGVLVEHFVSQAGRQSLMGTIFLGRVQNVLPSMEAAFVDIGRGRNAVLYAGEVNWDAAGLAGKARRIETALSPGDTLLVQVSKDPIGQKGARLTTQISLPGRFLVYVPGGGATGISRKLPDTERKRLKSILDRIVPEDAGVIIRTAAEGAPEDELIRDVERLQAQWTEISQAAELKTNSPVQLSIEPDTLTKVVRDLFNSDISRLVIDGDSAFESISTYVGAVAPELADRVSRYDGSKDVFAAYRIDEQIAKALERKVNLPSGGSLVIDRTEAMTVVDVNTGKYTGSGGNLEETVTRNNLEAAEEIVRQLRLRDIGGIIVVDFIDMVLESNRELVLRRLTECLGRDRTRHQVAEVTSLGLVQMTRKKMGTGLVEAFSEPCPHCGGRGIVLHDMPVDKGAPDEVDDGDRRSNRSRRTRTRPEPVDVPVVVAAIRPPDPRGPKPRSARSDDDVQLEPTEDELLSAIETPDAVGAPIEAEQSAVSATEEEQSVVAEAADAVSAVLAALDAAVAEPAPARPRRRRAASRPAGPAVPVVAIADTSAGNDAGA